MPNKIEGIVTPEIIQIVTKRMSLEEQKEADKEFLMALEPYFVNEMIKQSDNAVRLFEQKGIKADINKMIGDLVVTSYMRSALIYIQAIREYDTKKLNAMYNVDLKVLKEEMEDKLIDEMLKKKMDSSPEAKAKFNPEELLN
jgi:hypothetical protein